MIHEFNRSQEKLLIKPGALMMGAFLVALTFETTATINDRLSRTSRSTVDSVYNPRAEKSTLYIPGFHANGHVIGEMFHPVFSENGTTHAAVWETSGFRPDVTMERVVEARQKDDGVPLHVHVSSMGLHPFADWMKISEFRDKIGP